MPIYCCNVPCNVIYYMFKRIHYLLEDWHRMTFTIWVITLGCVNGAPEKFPSQELNHLWSEAILLLKLATTRPQHPRIQSWTVSPLRSTSLNALPSSISLLGSHSSWP